MSTTTAKPRATRAEPGPVRSTIGPLARVEMVRLARHPVLIVGALFGLVSTIAAYQEIKDDATGDLQGLPVTALTVGLPAMVAAHLLARSFDRTDELVESAPTSRVSRTGSQCLSAVVPAALAVVWLVLFAVAQRWLWTTPEWMYGTLSHADLWAVVIGNTVLAAVGGTLLGVAAGRWWHFRGSSIALLLTVAVWTLTVMSVFSPVGTPEAWYRWVRLFTPVGGFNNPAPDGNGSDTLTGSPWWYLAWLVTLCALAAVAALLKGSEGRSRRRLVRFGAAALAASVLTYGLAAAGGNSQVVRTFPDGHSVVLTP